MKLKKKISLLLAAVMTTSMANVPFATAEETSAIWKNFLTLDGLTEVPSSFEDEANGTETIETSDDPTHNEYFNLKLAAGCGWTDFRYELEDCGVNTTLNEPNNKVEFEIDLKAENLSTTTSKYYQFRFGGNCTYCIAINSNGSITANTTKTSIGTIGNMAKSSSWKWDDAIEWGRYKFIFEPVKFTMSEEDTTQYSGYKLVDMLLNGESVLYKTDKYNYNSTLATNPHIWSIRGYDDTNKVITYEARDNMLIKELYVSIPGNSSSGVTKMERNVSLDNITLVSYNPSETIPDRGTYLSDLRSAYAVYSEKAAASASAAPMIKLLDTINSGMTLFENKAATQEQFNAKKAELDACIENLKYLPNQLWFDDFSEDTTADYTLAAGIPSLTIDNTTFADDITLGNVIKMTRGSKVATEEDTTASSIYPRFSLDKVEIPIGGDEIAVTNGNNSFTEVEFDIHIDKNMLEGSTKTYHTAIFFKDTVNKVNAFSIKLNSTGTIEYGYNEPQVITTKSINDFVFDYVCE